MKYVLLSVALAFAASASAATLQSEVKAGYNKKVCIYSDGSSITVSEMSFCPPSK